MFLDCTLLEEAGECSSFIDREHFGSNKVLISYLRSALTSLIAIAKNHLYGLLSPIWYTFCFGIETHFQVTQTNAIICLYA